MKNDTEELCFKSFSEHNLLSFENGIDPEENLYGDYNANSDNSFYFAEIQDYLESLKPQFQVIAISETWITKEKGANFVLEGYDFFSVNRINKMGGEAAFYVQKDFQYNVTDTTVVNKVMESLTIEIQTRKYKYSIV